MKKICVTSINTSSYEELAEKTWHQNKVLYAQKHGYDTFQKNSDFKGVQFGFEKILYLIELLKRKEHEYIFYSDCDSMITNFEQKVENIINIADRHIYVTADCYGLNFGVMILKNSEESLRYLEFIWSKYDRYKDYGFFEQQVGMDYQKQFIDIMIILPQRVMNSYLSSELYPSQRLIDATGNTVDYQEGDFMVHWPACDLKKRLELFDRFSK